MNASRMQSQNTWRGPGGWGQNGDGQQKRSEMEEIKPRRPLSSRPRPASARPPAVEEAASAKDEDDGIFEDNETWLFCLQGPMNTLDIARMGFTNVVLLNADRWR